MKRLMPVQAIIKHLKNSCLGPCVSFGIIRWLQCFHWYSKTSVFFCLPLCLQAVLIPLLRKGEAIFVFISSAYVSLLSEFNYSI